VVICGASETEVLTQHFAERDQECFQIGQLVNGDRTVRFT